MRIGVIDSGVGGLTVLTQIVLQSPHHQFFYVADNARNPLGVKSAEEIQHSLHELIDFLMNMQIDLVVIACNTMGTHLDSRYQFFPIPILNIADYNLQLLEKHQSDDLIFMATQATISSPFFSRISHKAQRINGSSLVPLIEHNSAKDLIQEELKKLLSLFQTGTFSMVLGCTHFPLIKDSLHAFNSKLVLLDGSETLAKNIPPGEDKLEVKLYFSKKEAYEYAFMKALWSLTPFEWNQWK